MFWNQATLFRVSWCCRFKGNVENHNLSNIFKTFKTKQKKNVVKIKQVCDHNKYNTIIIIQIIIIQMNVFQLSKINQEILLLQY